MQIILCLFFFFLIVYSFVLRRRVVFFPSFLIFISILAIFIVLNPSFATMAANYLGIGRGADLILYLCVVAGLVVFVFMGIAIKKLSDDLTNLARSVAISGAYKKEDQN